MSHDDTPLLSRVTPSSPIVTPNEHQGLVPGGTTLGGAALDNQCLVQFIWQPLTRISSYSKVTLLTSIEVCIYMYTCDNYVHFFVYCKITHTHPHIHTHTHTQSGSVELNMDREGDYYISERVIVSSGTYEGMLAVGDSFIHPVENFTITEVEQIVLLEFKVGSSILSEHFDPHAAGIGVT